MGEGRKEWESRTRTEKRVRRRKRGEEGWRERERFLSHVFYSHLTTKLSGLRETFALFFYVLFWFVTYVFTVVPRIFLIAIIIDAIFGDALRVPNIGYVVSPWCHQKSPIPSTDFFFVNSTGLTILYIVFAGVIAGLFLVSDKHVDKY